MSKPNLRDVFPTAGNCTLWLCSLMLALENQAARLISPILNIGPQISHRNPALPT